MTPPTVLQVTFSGSGVVPLKYQGRDLVVEDDCATLDGNVLARWRDERSGRGWEIEGEQYDRFAVSWIESWPDVEV